MDDLLDDSATRDSGYDDLVSDLKEMVISTGREDGREDVRDDAEEKEVDLTSTAWPRPSPDFVLAQAQKVRIRLVCRVCNKEGDPPSLVLCGGCGAPHMPAHDYCLRGYPYHNTDPDEPGSYGGQCQEVDFDEFVYTSWLLDSNFLDKDKASLHADDLWSTWFGVPHDQEGRFPKFNIYPRLNRLISQVSDRPPRQYPSLVSFVGDTGSGKSTVIRAIIRFLAPREHNDFRAPVPGTASDGFDSTSSDVHLFSDPGTISSEVPLMFVDSEGFSGTDSPISRHILSDAGRSEVSQPLREGTLRGTPMYRPAKDMLAEHARTASSSIELKWGQVVVPFDTPITRKTPGQVDGKSRKIVVKTLYPRLLYAFSDVVCFVTNNSRASQDILEEMFRWAKDGHERTLNQRARPGLIIVLNKMAQEEHDVLSSVSNATKKLLDSFQKSTRFKELQRKWRMRGRTVDTAAELILCYYDSFRVISIPQYIRASPATAKKVSDQIKVLYREILSTSQNIRQKRQSLNMDLDVPSLNASLAKSAAALARDYYTSLDLHQISDSNSALPRKFSEHFVQLMSNMVKLRNLHTSQAVGGESELVTNMTPYVAACIVAQIDRTDNKEVRKRKDYLVEEAQIGLEQFRNRYWRCETRDSTGQRRCKNYWNSHDKGHQFDDYDRGPSDPSSENLEVGAYQSSYNPDAFTDQLWEEVSSLRSRGHSIERLASVANACGVTGITAQRTCLSCLSNTPTNMLPCRPKQHGICEDCIRRYNKTTGEESIIQITSCPLGCSLTKAPWSIRVKPRSAGARILALDGGGIRGIVEIAILAEIEKAVGYGVRIQELFDLVIGTSTGGLVALGVFEKNWVLHEADKNFRSLAQQAFSKRKALQVPILSKFAEPFCDYKYKSSGINKALQSTLGNDILFGQTGNQREASDQVKVGVVTCCEGNFQPTLVANYSRNPLEKLKDGSESYDCLLREDEQAKDFTVWQAGRATSAAQTLFKPYHHEPTDRSYVDGATVRNNPVRIAYEEERRIWNSAKPPDVIVSLGTGILVDKNGNITAKRNEHLEHIKKLLPKGIKKKVEAGLDMVQGTLDCHREWVDFVSPLPSRLRRNCHRLDIPLPTKPPALDDVESMFSLLSDSQTYNWRHRRSVAMPHMEQDYTCLQNGIAVVAARLRASLFYLHHFLPDDMKQGRYESTIYCRLTPHSEGAVALIAHDPVFRLREEGPNREEVIKPVKHIGAEKFNKKTLSSQVSLEISEGRFKRYIEIQFPRRDNWEAIGGF